ncbi:MAG: acyl-CoA thioesterase [Acidobacteriia bacterium]|nr:acyl-CoA thioesterase [Terriglobia bacterium]
MSYHDTTVRVRYAETDQMGVVYHSNHLIWFEIGRVELMRSMGISYKQMESQDDCYIFVAEAHCRYLAPARYDEVLRIRSWIAEAGSRIIKFAYEIARAEDEQLLATGFTKHVVCGKSGKPKALPAKYRAVLVASDGPAAKGKEA